MEKNGQIGIDLCLNWIGVNDNTLWGNDFSG